MTTNPTFDSFRYKNIQKTYDDIVIEAIKWAGHNIMYMPRTRNNYDKLYGQDDISSFLSALQIEAYIKNYQGFSGPGMFMGKFGQSEVREDMVFTVAKSRFENLIQKTTGQIRPNEGDLVFFPMAGRVYQINFVDYKPSFYQLGTLQTYDLYTELFEYSNELFHTGIEEIDAIQPRYTTDILTFAIYTNEGQFLTDENGQVLTVNWDIQQQVLAADNDAIQEGSDEIIDFNQGTDPLTGGGDSV